MLKRAILAKRSVDRICQLVAIGLLEFTPSLGRKLRKLAAWANKDYAPVWSETTIKVVSL